jgi:hypothetical protein
MADKKVGTSTGKKTQAGRDVYKTPEGEMVSEKSTTFKYKDMWINIPSIHNGHKYDDATLKLMLEAEIIKPTSSHKSREDAEQAARKRSDNLKFNKGGTAMKDQMSFFEDGGLKDEGGMVDEVSGNEVPSGSTRKEVRDDIPANISEGEFIFPADVVRFIGLEKLMQMRQMAKMGLKEMEAMGQMGNSEEATMPDDLPFGMADLIIVEGEDDSEENNFAIGGIQWPVSPADVPIENKVYINEAGNKINIRFQGDKPLDTIPDGYVLFTGQPIPTQPAAPASSGGGGSDEPAPKNPFVEAGGWADAPLDMYIKEIETISGATPNIVAGVASVLGGPLIGGLAYAANKYNKKEALKHIDARIEQAKKTTVPGQVAALRSAKEKLLGKKERTSIIGAVIGSIAESLGLTGEQQAAVTNTATKLNEVETPPKDVTPVDSSAIPLSPSLIATSKQTPFELSIEDYISAEEKEALGIPKEDKVPVTGEQGSAAVEKILQEIPAMQQDPTTQVPVDNRLTGMSGTIKDAGTPITTLGKIAMQPPTVVPTPTELQTNVGDIDRQTRAAYESDLINKGKELVAQQSKMASLGLMDKVKNAVMNKSAIPETGLTGTVLSETGPVSKPTRRAGSLTPVSATGSGRSPTTTTAPSTSTVSNNDRDDRSSFSETLAKTGTATRIGSAAPKTSVKPPSRPSGGPAQDNNPNKPDKPKRGGGGGKAHGGLMKKRGK